MSRGNFQLSNWAEKTLVTLFVLVWTLMASIGMYIFAVRPIAQVIAARDWPTVPCNMVYSKVTAGRGESSGYRIDVLFWYEYEGKQYQSSHYQFPIYNKIRTKSEGNQAKSTRYEYPASNTTSFSSRESAQKAVDLLESQSQTLCYVNPDNPSEATLHRGLASFLWWGLIPLGLLLLPAVGFGGMLADVCGWLMGRRRVAASSSLDNNEMTRRLFRVLVGTCLVSLCYGLVLFAIAWRDVHSGVSVSLATTQRSIAERVAEFRSSSQKWRRVAMNTKMLSAKVTHQGSRNETVYWNSATDETLCIQKVSMVKSKHSLKHPLLGGYADIRTKQIVDDWANDNGFIAEGQLRLHLAERFDAGSFYVVTVEDHGEFLTLQLTADCWEVQREFALMADGALCW
jgi:hypothetical protein